MVGWHHWLDGHSLSKFRKLVMDREAWRAAVAGVTKSQTWLSNWTELRKLAGGKRKVYQLGNIFYSKLNIVCVWLKHKIIKSSIFIGSRKEFDVVGVLRFMGENGQGGARRWWSEAALKVSHSYTEKSRLYFWAWGKIGAAKVIEATDSILV